MRNKERTRAVANHMAALDVQKGHMYTKVSSSKEPNNKSQANKVPNIDESIQQLHAKIPYVSTPQEKSDSWRSLVALDCEMVR